MFTYFPQMLTISRQCIMNKIRKKIKTIFFFWGFQCLLLLPPKWGAIDFVSKLTPKKATFWMYIKQKKLLKLRLESHTLLRRKKLQLKVSVGAFQLRSANTSGLMVLGIPLDPALKGCTNNQTQSKVDTYCFLLSSKYIMEVQDTRRHRGDLLSANFPPVAPADHWYQNFYATFFEETIVCFFA